MEYTAPGVVVIGTLHDLTLRDKDLGKPNDGDYFRGQSLKNVS